MVPTDGSDDIFMVSSQGQALRFSEDDVRAMGRSAAGVQGMKFRDGDHLVSCAVLADDTELLIITSEGFGKRTDPELFTPKGRAGLGVRCVRVNEQRGHVVGAMFVAPDDEIMLISNAGVVIRTSVADISQQGRDATGVTVMSLSADDQVSAVARLFSVDDDELDGDVAPGSAPEPGEDALSDGDAGSDGEAGSDGDAGSDSEAWSGGAAEGDAPGDDG